MGTSRVDNAKCSEYKIQGAIFRLELCVRYQVVQCIGITQLQRFSKLPLLRNEIRESKSCLGRCLFLAINLTISFEI